MSGALRLCPLCPGERGRCQVWTLCPSSAMATLGVHFPELCSRWRQHFHHLLQGALIRAGDKPRRLPRRKLPAVLVWALEALRCVGVGSRSAARQPGGPDFLSQTLCFRRWDQHPGRWGRHGPESSRKLQRLLCHGQAGAKAQAAQPRWGHVVTELPVLGGGLRGPWG